ncbi:MAG: phosphorylcholine transferase LicD [Roseburia sp.]
MKEEIRYIEYQSDQLEKVHRAELTIYKEFARICDKHNLPYFFVYGSLIGVVRHQGFIPWDDDLDVGMLREDYDKFMEIAPKELGDRFFLQNLETDPCYHLAFAKVRMNGTRFVEGQISDSDMHLGIYMDIFPFDQLLEGAAGVKQVRKVNFWRFLSVAKRVKQPQIVGNGFIFSCGRAAWRILYYGMKIFHVSPKYLDRKLDQASRMGNGSDSRYVTLMCSMPMESRMTRADMFPLQEMPFEDLMVKVPANYDEHLTHMYGDYMQLPPKEKRVNHMPVELDLGDEFWMKEESLDKNN